MRKLVLALVMVVGTLHGAVVFADPAPRGEPYITWLEDRYTETWTWFLKDAPVDIAGATWHLVVQVHVRDHGRPLRDPSAVFTFATPASQPGYVACPGVGVIADGEALQGIQGIGASGR